MSFQCPCFNPFDGRITTGKHCCEIKELATMPESQIAAARARYTDIEWAEIRPAVVARKKLIREQREARINAARNLAINTLKERK